MSFEIGSARPNGLNPWLRISEGVGLEVAEIDSARMVLTIRAAKGQKDRCVPLPTTVLALLRTQWCTHRHPRWLFPARFEGHAIPNATQPMSARAVSTAWAAAIAASGIPGLSQDTQNFGGSIKILDIIN